MRKLTEGEKEKLWEEVREEFPGNEMMHRSFRAKRIEMGRYDVIA